MDEDECRVSSELRRRVTSVSLLRRGDADDDALECSLFHFSIGASIFEPALCGRDDFGTCGVVSIDMAQTQTRRNIRKQIRQQELKKENKKEHHVQPSGVPMQSFERLGVWTAHCEVFLFRPPLEVM